MTITKTLTPGWHLYGAAALAVCLLLWISAESAKGQTAGNNAVYNSSGHCSTSSQCAGSSAFIDASALVAPNDTVCSTIYKILQSPSYSAAVIDARGLNSSNENMTCAQNWSPWYNGAIYLNKPSVILLPAGTIITSFSWVLPTNTKLIGVAKGTNSSGNNYLSETTIESQFNGGAVVQFGDSHCPSAGCQGISVEHLTIYGFGNIVNGIENDNCGLLCYADHVTMYQVLGTGLNVSGVNATDSGPYSNITYDVGNSPNSSTQCAKIINTNHVPHSRPFFPGSA
jgi:hypothetical protein